MPVGEYERPLGEAWRQYFLTTSRLSAVLEQSLKEKHGISMGEYNLLLILTEAPENTMRMGEIARRMVFAPSRLTYLAKTMARDGLVTRHQSDLDGRSWELTLADKGRTVFRRAAVSHAADVKQLFTDQLQDGDARALHEIFTRVGHHLTELGF